MKIIGVIPARYASSRLPGKPLCEIEGKPMIWWVYQNACKVKEFDKVYIATDDSRIREKCEALGMNAVMTSEKHRTGTDRAGEVAEAVDADVYVNIQGDEPLLEPEVILRAVEPFLRREPFQVTNLMTKITDPVDLINSTVPKVIVNDQNFGIYLTRSAAPYPKGALDTNFFKQVCVYGFSKEALRFFCRTERGRVERAEDIEILRFIENGHRVKYIEVETASVAVDTEKDLHRVRLLMKEKKEQG